MTIIVPRRPPILVPHGSSSNVRAALPVRGNRQWTEIASGGAFLLGRGSQLVCGGTDGEQQVIGAGQTELFPFWIWPHEGNATRLWCFQISMVSQGYASGFVGAEDTGGSNFSSAPWTIDPSVLLEQPVPFRLVQYADGDATPREVVFSITNSGTSTVSVRLEGVTCCEIPCPQLPDADDITEPDGGTVETGRAIYAASDNSASIDAAHRAIVSARYYGARRACMFSWVTRDGTYVTSTEVADPGSNILLIDPIAVNRKIHSADLTRPIAWAARVEAIGGAGIFRVTSADGGDTSDVAIPADSGMAWIVGELFVTVDDMETLDTTGGLPGGLADLVQPRMWCDGATEVRCSGFCFGEGVSENEVAGGGGAPAPDGGMLDFSDEDQSGFIPQM